MVFMNDFFREILKYIKDVIVTHLNLVICAAINRNIAAVSMSESKILALLTWEPLCFNYQFGGQ